MVGFFVPGSPPSVRLCDLPLGLPYEGVFLKLCSQVPHPVQAVSATGDTQARSRNPGGGISTYTRTPRVESYSKKSQAIDNHLQIPRTAQCFLNIHRGASIFGTVY